jgi:hypothetical protein
MPPSMGQRMHCRNPPLQSPENNQQHGKSRNDADASLARMPQGHGHRSSVRSRPPAIALTITMPHAWVNINTAAALPRRCDPICTTCDIQATLCARQRTGCRCGSLRCRIARAKNLPLIFCTPACARERAPNVSPQSLGWRCGHQRAIRHWQCSTPGRCRILPPQSQAKM